MIPRFWVAHEQTLYLPHAIFSPRDGDRDRTCLDKVTIMDASVAVTGTELDYGLLVLSSTPGSGDIRGKFANSPVPIINCEEAVIDNGSGEFGASSAVLLKSSSTTEMMLNDHPISAGLPETITLYEGVVGQTNSTSAVFENLAIVGTAVQGTSNAGPIIGEDVSGRAMIIAIEAGDAVDSAVGTTDDTAPARRVMLPFNDGAFADLTPEAGQLFLNSLRWATGALGALTGPEITALELDITNPGNPIANITFSSRSGQHYSLFTSDDHSDFSSGLGNSEEVDDSIIATGSSTMVSIDYQDFGISTDAVKRFFFVLEVGGE